MRDQRRRLIIACLAIACITIASPTKAGSWTWEWRPASGESPPQVEICPLKYGKTWAYAVEVDDGPASTLTVAQPLLARFAFPDSPPGLPGGKARPFVGGAAVMLQWVGTSNETHLSGEQIAELRRRGWGVLNHSYWHTGNHWDPAQALKPADFRRELFWSRAMLGDSADAHFVYPSGDFNYRPYLVEAGIRSASRVGGRCRSIIADAASFLDLDRNHLDEAVWSKSGETMLGFPVQGPKPGDVIIDFTHDIDADQDSRNHRRWVDRLSKITANHGDTVWSAPTTDLVAYTLAARSATVSVEKGRLTVALPDSEPASPLTVKLTGIDERSTLESPPGGLLYRQGDQAWITTPTIAGRPPAPGKPPITLVYQGPLKDVTLDPPRAIAGVRLLQSGETKPIRIDLVHPDGTVDALVKSTRIKPQWGTWLLYPTIPDRPAVLAKEVHVEADRAMKRMEIWAVADESAKR